MRAAGGSDWKLWPASAALALFFVLPLGYFLVVSFWRLRSYKLVPTFTLDNYALVFAEYSGALAFTLALALVVAAVSTVLGFAIAYMARFRAGRWGQVILFVVLVTLFGGYLVKIFAWKTILGTNGVLNNALMALGIVSEPVSALLYSPLAVVITLVHFLLPFTVLPIYGSLRGVADTPLAAARDLGAGNMRVLRDMVLPQCQAGIFAAFAIAFLISVGDYVTPRLVGGPDSTMVGNFVESQFVNRLNAPVGSALSYTMLAISMVVLFGFRAGLRAMLGPR
ncbi:MAG: ABC transporter permease [Rhizobiaceae bacterium]|nr:ABC transporter permease [Rhizobiaceae bacterium]